jgi:glycyl-tRNA synthetase beta chain
MLNALLEIGCEEIPARFMPAFLADLKQKAEEKLTKERIGFGQVHSLGTYRRLVLFIEDIAPRQEDLREEVKGPPAEIAFDKGGKPTPAAQGFAKSQNVTLKDLIVRPLGPKNYVFAKVTKIGQPTAKVLEKVFPEIIAALYQPLSMRWADVEFKFIRPIHWITALCGSQVVKFSLAGIKASHQTSGHRYLKGKAKALKFTGAITLRDYKQALKKLHVLVDPAERKAALKKQIEALAKTAKAEALMSEELLNEVTFLVECPLAYRGSFEPRFLAVPQEVLITSMQKNQKYFPLVDKAGKLLPQFIVVTDNCRNPLVVAGNQKVLSARLSDAKFFFEEDKKLSLKMRVPELEKTAFFEKLGSMRQKGERMAELATFIGKKIGVGEEGIKDIKQIAALCKADLNTRMVYEFPELQGVMGKVYALLAGENQGVAEGIFEHYLPRFAEDRLPATLPGTAVALADKIDSLVGCFSIGAIPSGSEDPFGLRRAVQGIIRMILEKKLDLLLDELLDHSLKLYASLIKPLPDAVKVNKLIIDFIAVRLRQVLAEKGIRYDVIDAVLDDYNDILDVEKKAVAMNQLLSQAWFAGVALSADRITRITKGVKREQVIEADFTDPEEKSLYAIYLKVNWEVGEAVKREEWEKALQSLAELSLPLEQFFDKVLVMHEDEKLRQNRLALLKTIGDLYARIANFSRIVKQA